MERKKAGTVIMVIGLLILAAGFIPLTKTVVVTEEKTRTITEYREETKTKEEPYIEEKVTGTEKKEEVLLRESILVIRTSILGKTFTLTAGDIIRFKAHADGDMMISFTGQGEIYMSGELGTDIEKEFTIKKDGEHTLLYSAPVAKDITINFDIVRVYNAPVVEKVEKTRIVEYKEKVPYTVEEPYTEQRAREEKYNVWYLQYCGIGVAVAGLLFWGFKSKDTEKKEEKDSGKKPRKKKK